MSDSVTDIVDELADMEGNRTIGDVIEAIQHRGAAPFLIVPALIELSPVGAIPGMPTLLALIIVIFAVQIALGQTHLWAPERIRARDLPDDKFDAVLKKVRPWAEWLDQKLASNRLQALVSAPARQAAGVLVVLLCLLVPPLEVIPWASAIPMSAILFIGLALLLRNGIVMLAACAISVAALYATYSLLA